MQLLIFLITYPILWIISILPFRIFYWFSDFIFFIVFHVLRYRRKVVRENLSLTLPHLNSKERVVIEKKFYSHMCDIFMEMIKTISISEKEIRKRFVFTNMEVYNEMAKDNKSIILMLAHYASWEWLVSISLYTNLKGFGVYTKIQNPYFDNLIKRIRSKFKGELISTKDTIKTVVENASKNIQCVYGFVSDQSPMLQKSFYWDNFMGIEVPIHTGAEMLAKRCDLNVLFVKIEKVKRGHYEATFVKLVDDSPKNHPDYEISSLFLREAEKQILEAPEFYLWTHKRWKHRNKKHEVRRNID